MGWGSRAYCLWAVLAIACAIGIAGLNAESITRLCVILFLLSQIALRSFWLKAFSSHAARIRFLILALISAAVVEGFHMISTPVFLSLRIGWNTSLFQGLSYYAIDLLFTLPAYFVIFSLIWVFINRYEYSFWYYVFSLGFAQTIGDGGLFFFLNAPVMLVFLPYPMSNYHAINVIPFLAVEGELQPNRSKSLFSLAVIPGVILTYLLCGAIIKILGRACGLEPI
jgi:hypothetical protein